MKLVSHTLILIVLSSFFASCSGYRVKKNTNPFISHGIQSLAMPMFVNRSTIPGVAAVMTREINLMLSENLDLEIYNGENKAADAILIGIVDSADKRSDVFDTVGTKFTNNGTGSSIGNRNQFFVPTITEYKVSLRLILIKKPNANDMKLIQSDLLNNISRHPKVIFDELFNFSRAFSRVVNENTSVDDGGVVNSTKNKAFFEQSLNELAFDASKTFKEVVLDAF